MQYIYMYMQTHIYKHADMYVHKATCRSRRLRTSRYQVLQMLCLKGLGSLRKLCSAEAPRSSAALSRPEAVGAPFFVVICVLKLLWYRGHRFGFQGGM